MPLCLSIARKQAREQHTTRAYAKTKGSSPEMTEPRQVDSPPSKLPRLSGADANDAGAVTMARAAPATAPLVLGLGLGVGGSRSDSSGSDDAEAAPATTTTVVTLARSSSALTFMQRQELEQQVLIYRYIVASAPVPVNLVIPIWNSVAASSPAPQRFPSLAGLGRMCFDARSSMEPEPDRCRRTDGKKWRCSRGVVPGCKYCERHVHRGRGRSRKPVEAPNPIRAVHAADAQATPRSHAPPPPQGFGSPAGVFLAHGTARAT